MENLTDSKHRIRQSSAYRELRGSLLDAGYVVVHTAIDAFTLACLAIIVFVSLWLLEALFGEEQMPDQIKALEYYTLWTTSLVVIAISGLRLLSLLLRRAFNAGRTLLSETVVSGEIGVGVEEQR